MLKSKLFEREIALIQSEDLRDFMRYYFEEIVGDWFWKSGASSSGRFHPVFAQGEGGLVKHTRAVVMFCAELLHLNSYAFMNDEYKDFALVACLLHDTCKYGEGNEICKSAYPRHGEIAAMKVDLAWREFFLNDAAPELLLMAIRSHMGQWTEDKDDRPFTQIDRLVHLADYLASRSFIDIPQLSLEYEQDVNPATVLDDDLPF